MGAGIAVRARTIHRARSCITARARRKDTTISAQNTHGTPDAFGSRSKSFKPETGTMGTELIIVGLTVVLYAACAFFVRICDRI